MWVLRSASAAACAARCRAAACAWSIATCAGVVVAVHREGSQNHFLPGLFEIEGKTFCSSSTVMIPPTTPATARYSIICSYHAPGLVQPFEFPLFLSLEELEHVEVLAMVEAEAEFEGLQGRCHSSDRRFASFLPQS